jgi:hypothetical protein
VAYGLPAGVLAAGPVETTLLLSRVQCRIGYAPRSRGPKQPGQKPSARALRTASGYVFGPTDEVQLHQLDAEGVPKTAQLGIRNASGMSPDRPWPYHY